LLERLAGCWIRVFLSEKRTKSANFCYNLRMEAKMTEEKAMAIQKGEWSYVDLLSDMEIVRVKKKEVTLNERRAKEFVEMKLRAG